MTRRPSAPPPISPGGQELVVLRGGPRDSAWFFATDWDAMLRATERMGDVMVYVATSEYDTNPESHRPGLVWRYDAHLADERDRRRADRQRRDVERGKQLGHAGKDLAEQHTDADLKKLARRILRHAAEKHQFLSADTIRDDLDAMDYAGPARGGLWAHAIAQGWVTEVGKHPSGGESAHGKDIATYRSEIYLEKSA